MPRSQILAFLFTDVEGSTQLWERFPDAMKGALKRHDVLLRGAIEASGGQVVKTTGDGMMAVFATAVDATAAALAAQLGLASETWGETGPLRVRMGVHCGPAQQRGDDFFGPTINRTARIMAAGHGGQVLLSESAGALVRDSLPPGAELLDLGEYRLKDLSRPEHLFQLAHPDLVSTFPPLVTARSPEGELPTRMSRLIGRRREIGDITDRLADGSIRLLTLTGPGGTGKTALAIQVAQELGLDFPDSVLFVDLSGARDTQAVLVALARSVGLGEIIDRPLEDELIAHVGDRRMLVVLDNLEQVTEAAGAVSRVLGGCRRLTFLATSREALHIRAEQVFPVPPLGLPPDGREVSPDRIGESEAVQLFVDRARAVRPDFELTDENAVAVADICRRLDGLPLAIELAVAHLRLFSPEDLRERLGRRLDLLRNGPRDLPERQQTLRSTIDWSYGLLAPAEQRLFELLAVFADCEIEAVESVVTELAPMDDLEVDVLDGLAALVDKSLLRLVDGPAGEGRVSMLETVREFATERLGSRPEVAALARRSHATYFADRAAALRSDLVGPQRHRALTELGADAANLRIAWRYWVAEEDREHMGQLAEPLFILDDAHGWYLDTVALTQDLLTVLAASPRSPEQARKEIALRTKLARALMTTKGFTPETEAAYASAVALFEQGTDAGQQYHVLRGLASLYMFRGDVDEMTRLGRQILALGEGKDDPTMRIDGHLLVGTGLMFFEDLRGGLDQFDQAIALFPALESSSKTLQLGNDPRISCLTTSALTLWLLGYPDGAAQRADAALALAARLEHPFSSAYARFHAGLVRLWRRDSEVALDLATGLCEFAQEHEFRIWMAAGGCLLGAAQAQSGRFDEGLATIRKGIDRYEDLRSPPIFYPLLLSLQARASVEAGRPADGRQALDSAIEILSRGARTSILPEAYVLKGDLLAALPAADGGGAAAAEACYRLAFDRAGTIDAGMARLRAATRLARLRIADGDADAAAATLRPVYETFTEGFDTPDLREARELLGGLVAAEMM